MHYFMKPIFSKENKLAKIMEEEKELEEACLFIVTWDDVQKTFESNENCVIDESRKCTLYKAKETGEWDGKPFEYLQEIVATIAHNKKGKVGDIVRLDDMNISKKGMKYVYLDQEGTFIYHNNSIKMPQEYGFYIKHGILPITHWNNILISRKVPCPISELKDLKSYEDDDIYTATMGNFWLVQIGKPKEKHIKKHQTICMYFLCTDLKIEFFFILEFVKLDVKKGEIWNLEFMFGTNKAPNNVYYR